MPFPPISRRQAIQSVASAAAVGLTAGCRTGVSLGKADRGLVRRENGRTGTLEWMLERSRIDPATKWRCPWIEGYCSHTSLPAGQTLEIFVSTRPASDFTVDIY